jgi:thiol-disulfide isomerase/thioredoxin
LVLLLTCQSVSVPDQSRNRTRARAVTTIGIAVALIVVLIVAKYAAGPSAKSGIVTSAASTAANQQVTHVPPAVLATVGAGTAKGAPQPLTGQPVADEGGKPTVLFIGAEWCPYCAAERWPMVIALSRFGTFGPLNQTGSSPGDAYPNTATLSLHGVSYTSAYLSFDAKEIQSNQAHNGKYRTLDTLTSAESKLFHKAGGGVPYVNLAGRYRVLTQLDPAVLKGKTVDEVAIALSDPSSPIAAAVDGAANLFTAALCQLTGNQPGSVCAAAPIPSLVSRLDHG